MTDQASASHNTDEPWCNCQAIPGTVNYPGPWHPQYDPVSCKATRVARVSVGCAGTPGAQVIPGQTTVHAVSTVDEENAARRMARARQWMAHEGGARCGMPVPEWDGLTPDEQAQAEGEARRWINAAVNAGVAIAPVGRAAEPDEDERQTLMRILDKHLDSPDMADWERRDRASKARLYADRVLAAGYRRVVPASGSQVGDQHGE